MSDENDETRRFSPDDADDPSPEPEKPVKDRKFILDPLL